MYSSSIMQNDSPFWFPALASITGLDAASGEETVSGAAAKWLEWGNAHGYTTAAGVSTVEEKTE